MSHELRKGKKAGKNSYFTSVARNTHPLTNKPGAEGGSHTPLAPSVLRFTGISSYVKLHEKERSRNKDMRSSLGTEIGMSSLLNKRDCGL